MKKLIILAVALALFGCGSTTNQATSNTDVDSQSVKTVGVGEICGRSIEISCETGLECQLERSLPNNTGVCIETVVDKNAECSQTKAPVCGLKGRQKNGYLNECEALRHGAVILNEWFCKVEPETKNNCEAKVLGIGNCEAFIIGYEFDGKQCQEVGVSGCEAEVPFNSIEECQMACE